MVNSKRAGERLAKKLGANLAVRRKARKWSQEDLAERMGEELQLEHRAAHGNLHRSDVGKSHLDLSTALTRVGQ